MKLLLLLIVLVGVFRANCREIHDRFDDQGPDTGYTESQHPASRLLNHEVQFMSNELVETGFTEGPENQDSSDADNRLQKYGNEQYEVELRGKSEKKILQKLLKKFEFLESNLTQANLDMERDFSNMASKLDSLKTANLNQDAKLDSLKAADINQDSKLNSIKTSITNQNPKLNSVRAGIANLNADGGCPSDMFILHSTNQCFKLYHNPWTGRNWTSANEQCLDNGLVMARPYDPYSLRKYVATTFNPPGSSWVGGQGNGTSLKWQRDGWSISNTSSLWLNGNPGNRVTANDYLLLETRNSSYMRYPNQPLGSSSSERKLYVVCELVLNSLFNQV